MSNEDTSIDNIISILQKHNIEPSVKMESYGFVAIEDSDATSDLMNELLGHGLVIHRDMQQQQEDMLDV